MSNIIFNHGWHRTDGEIRGFDKTRSSDTTFMSLYNDVQNAATINKYFTEALLMYVLDGLNPILDITVTGDGSFLNPENSSGAIRCVDDNLYLAEYALSEDKLQLALYNSDSGEFVFAVQSDDGGETFKPFVLEHSTTVLWLAIMPQLFSRFEELNRLDDDRIKRDLISDYEQIEKLAISELSYNLQQALYIANDCAYRTIDKEYKCVIPSSNMFPTTSKGILESYKSPDNWVGTFRTPALGGSKKTKTTESIDASALLGRYALNEEISKDAPVMPDWYVVPKWVLKAAHNIQFHNKSSINASIKQNNIALFGGCGSGKSEGAKAIASALGIPCTHISCSANTDEYVFTGNIQPKLSESNPDEAFVKVLNGYTDEDLDMSIDLQPEVLYKKLTGIYNLEVTEKEIRDRIAELRSLPSESLSKNGIEYEFVPSPFVKALEEGHLICIEEPTNIRDSGVLIILNQIMDSYQSITLPTGRVVHRHPNTVVCFAANVDEQNCGDLEASTISRLHTIYKIETPSKSELIERVKRNTGYEDNTVLDKMADVVLQLANFIKDHQLNGCCGVREFICWVAQHLSNLDFDEDSTLFDSALETIIPSCSPRSDDMEEVTDFVRSKL